jgi:hypothetical protein
MYDLSSRVASLVAMVAGAGGLYRNGEYGCLVL